MTGCSRREFVPHCPQVLWEQRGYLHFQPSSCWSKEDTFTFNQAVVGAKRTPSLSSSNCKVLFKEISMGDNIRHFARPYPLRKSESEEKAEKRQVSL